MRKNLRIESPKSTKYLKNVYGLIHFKPAANQHFKQLPKPRLRKSKEDAKTVAKTLSEARPSGQQEINPQMAKG
jgi:hypothetical protein